MFLLTDMEFKNGVFNAARDGNLRRLKVGAHRSPCQAREAAQGVRQGDRAQCGSVVSKVGKVHPPSALRLLLLSGARQADGEAA